MHLLDPPLIEMHEQGASTRHMRGAMYLSGYGVECQLKAYLIKQHPPLDRLSDVLAELRTKDPNIRDICGAAGHDLEYLLQLSELETSLGSQQKINWNICKKWKSSWRYDPSSVDRRVAEEMVSAARSLVMWIRSQI